MASVPRNVLLPTVIAAAVLAAGCGAVGGSIGPGSAHTESGTERAGAVDRVQVDADSGTVALRSGPDASSSVDRTLRWDDGPKPEVTQTVEGRTLHVTARCPAGSDGCETDLTVTVPAASSATVRLGTGDVGVDGLHGAQDLRNSTGPVHGTGLGPAPVTARTDTGPVDVALASAAPTVTAGSGTGSTTVRVPRDATYQVRAGAGTGRADVDVPDTPGAGHVVDAHCDTGAVSVAFA